MSYYFNSEVSSFLKLNILYAIKIFEHSVLYLDISFNHLKCTTAETYN